MKAAQLTDFGAAAEATLRLFAAQMHEGGGNASLLHALEECLEPPRLVILRGPGIELRQWKKQLDCVYMPQTLTLALGAESDDLPEALAKPQSDAVNAWVCSGVTCLPPIADWRELQRCLSAAP